MVPSLKGLLHYVLYSYSEDKPAHLTAQDMVKTVTKFVLQIVLVQGVIAILGDA